MAANYSFDNCPVSNKYDSVYKKIIELHKKISQTLKKINL